MKEGGGGGKRMPKCHGYSLQSLEDPQGDRDFKVAGTSEGITSLKVTLHTCQRMCRLVYDVHCTCSVHHYSDLLVYDVHVVCTSITQPVIVFLHVHLKKSILYGWLKAVTTQ